MRKSKFSKFGGKFKSVRIVNSKTDKTICGRFRSETPNYVFIENVHTGEVDKYAKSSVLVK